MTKSGGGNDTITKTYSFTYVLSTGLLKTETIEPGNALTSTKTYIHDGFGNIVKTIVATLGGTRTSSSVYDSSGRFLISESNHLGHTVSYSYDTQSALLRSMTDIARKTTTFGYDDYGTLIRTYHPDGTQTGESTGLATNSFLPADAVAYLTEYVCYFRAKQTSGAPVAKVYLDYQGKPLVTETTLLKNAAASSASVRYTKVYTVTQYDRLGRKSGISEAFASGESRSYTRIFYDAVGRVLKTTQPGNRTDEVLEFSTVTLAGKPVSYSRPKNPNDAILERWEDQHARLIQSKDESTQLTTFDHDQEGRVLKVFIDGTKFLENTFDLFGNKTSVWEKNSGTSTSIYNGYGEVTSTTNAKGQTTTFTYDNLGRPLTTAKTQFGETFTTTIYDALGRVYSETNAGGLTVMHEYDPLYFFPTRLSIGLGSPGANTTLWQAGTYDSKGRAITQTLAQGVATSAAYNDLSDRLESPSATQSGTTLQAKSYDWDLLGNLKSRTDAIANRLETFQYDKLNRVVKATVTAISGATNTIVPPVANFTYDDKGNLLTKAGATLTYAGIRPHAVSSATG